MIPRDPSPESGLAVLREGYDFIPSRSRRFGSDIFAARVMGRKVTCLTGAEAAAQFYVPRRFTRRGALPAPTFSLIQDFGSVMALDGEDHRHRKALLLSILAPEALGRLPGLTEHHWRRAAARWVEEGEVSLFDAAHEPLTAAITEWAGLALPPGEVRQRAREFRDMVEGTGSIGWRNLRGHWQRRRTERWARGVIEGIREGRLGLPPGSAAASIAAHRDREGRLLDVVTAGVELINILRPTVANARWVMFIALALHQHPEWQARLAEEEWVDPFVQEVRRLYPFIPFMGGIVRQPFRWRDHDFREGDWVLLDLFGTGRDPAAWEEPDAFRPERWRGADWVTRPGFIPHGGGEHAMTHRCPGEWVTVEQMKVITRLMARDIRWEVPPQDLSLPPGRMPALPRSRFRIRVRS